MALPHFSYPHPPYPQPSVKFSNSPEPIFKNKYDIKFINNDNIEITGQVESFEISNDVIICQIQDYPEMSFSDIKDIKIIIIEHVNKSDNVVRMNILKVRNINCKSSFGWDDIGLSYIESTFSILESNSISGDKLQNKDSIIKSLLRDEKLNDILE